MPDDISTAILDHYGTAQDALEDMCDTLILEEPYADLFGDEQLAFHDWAFANAHDSVDGKGIDWVGAFYDWRED